MKKQNKELQMPSELIREEVEITDKEEIKESFEDSIKHFKDEKSDFYHFIIIISLIFVIALPTIASFFLKLS